MREMLLTGRQQLELVERDTPVPEPGQVLVEVDICGVCPSDVRKWSTGADDLNGLPVNLGHETVGRVVEVGSAGLEHLHGRRVFADGYGGFATHRLVDAGAFTTGAALVLPEELSDEQAVFIEPLADCLFAVEERADLRSAAGAVVLGCGQMGLQVVQLLLLAGLEAYAVDPVAHRRARAGGYGARPVAGDPAQQVAEVRERSGGGVEVAIVATPAPGAVETAVRMLAVGGRCVLFAGYRAGERLSLPAELLHARSLHLVGSRWIGVQTPRFPLYRRAAELLLRRRVDISGLVESRFPLPDVALALHQMRELQVLKAAVLPQAGGGGTQPDGH